MEVKSEVAIREEAFRDLSPDEVERLMAFEVRSALECLRDFARRNGVTLTGPLRIRLISETTGDAARFAESVIEHAKR